MPRPYGYLTVDHRNSPGIPGSKMFGKGSFAELDTYSCGHCQFPQTIVRKAHSDFTGPKCPKCFKPLCEPCAAAFKGNHVCKPFAQVIEEVTGGKTPIPLLARDVKA